MKKKLRIIEITSAILFLLYIITTIKFANGSILRIQAYTDMSFLPIFFWTSLILICIRIMIADTGFIKIGISIGLALAIFVLVRQIVFNPYKFERLLENNHDIIVQVSSVGNERSVTVYKKENLFFSRFVGSVDVPLVYELVYEIEGDELVVYKCAAVSCVTEEINLN